MNNFRFSKLFLPKVTAYLIAIILLIVSICIIKPSLIIAGVVFIILLILYSINDNNIRKKEIIKYIENLNFDISSVTKGTLLNFPLPMLVVEQNGEVVWYNSLFLKMVEDNKDQKGLEELLKAIVLEEESTVEKNIIKDIVIEGKNYKVLGNYVNLEGAGNNPRYISMLYFLDQTELVQIREKHEESFPVVSIIMIDNYEELMQNSDESFKPQILAEIDRRIGSWASSSNGILKKFERDKYLFVFENKYFEKFEEKKFEIIDSIKEIQMGNKFPVTLSIGIGLGTENLVDKIGYASASLDIALGRGGDQAVIKNGDKFTFYGGRTKEIEKRTRVKARVVAHALRELIKQAQQVIIMGHVNADMDALGAALGIYRIAKVKEKDAYIVLNSSNVMIDVILEKVNESEEYGQVFIGKNEALDRINKNTLLIVVDTNRPALTECPELLKFTDKIVVIDHHRRSADFIQEAVLAFHETYASSTSELVTEIVHYMEEEVILNTIEAEALYAGIAIDTKKFTFKAGIRTFEAAAFLKKFGVDALEIKELFKNDITTYIARSEIVKSAEFIDNIAISVCLENGKNTPLIIAQAADELLDITGVSASFVLGNSKDGVSISGRSLGDINVQVILEKLGGGGHITVAGAKVPDVDIEEAKEMLKAKIYEYIEENKET
jgi:c-di-AMP phosphodiesterase-like protein